jgi:hypothetical protein
MNTHNRINQHVIAISSRRSHRGVSNVWRARHKNGSQNWFLTHKRQGTAEETFGAGCNDFSSVVTSTGCVVLQQVCNFTCKPSAAHNIIFLAGKPQRKRSLWRPRRRWMDNIKIGLREIGISGGLLWTRWRIFGFHKMLGSSWVVSQLAASQEGFSSIQLVS